VLFGLSSPARAGATDQLVSGAKVGDAGWMGKIQVLKIILLHLRIRVTGYSVALRQAQGDSGDAYANSSLLAITPATVTRCVTTVTLSLSKGN